MSGERVLLLKERAEAFLSLANELFTRGRLDIASFCIEQACQLRIKACLLRLFGYMPRIHSIRELLGILAKELEKQGYISESDSIILFARKYRESLADIEESYIESRYGLPVFTEKNIKEMLETAHKLFSLLDRVEESVLD